ncbi:MAG TPA: hypothetical protein VEI54_01240 [Candidatus Limnocylindrales bacterium]|nr:hypothetical protein [Candidatus Limnocylindrales bacterium]
MRTHFVCLVVLLGTIHIAQPAKVQAEEESSFTEQPLCRLTRSAANQPGLEGHAFAYPQDTELLTVRAFDAQPALLPGESSFAGNSDLLADRKLFERFLVDWLFFEDLAPEQRALIGRLLARCQGLQDSAALAASVFAQLDASQRATFVSITHALLNTQLIDRLNGQHLGHAIDLVEDLVDIQGQNDSLPSDHQFQLLVRLAPDAAEKLEHTTHFEKGENRVYHKGFPLSFRQFRKIGLHGKEAGLHFCITRDGRFAQIHVDYRFGLLHLVPTNSDVRAEGNHQRHVDRWPQFGFGVKRVQVRSVVLRRRD